jgi:hypothetical protein
VSSDVNDFEKNIKVFNPRIPQLRVKGENGEIRRICFSDDIRKCLIAMPEYEDDGIYVGEMTTLGMGMRSTIQNRFGVPALFSVYELDTDDIKRGNVLTPQELNEKGYVPDCLKNSEYWVTGQNVKSSRLETVRYVDFNEEAPSSSKDNEIHYSNLIYERSIEKYDRECKYVFLSKMELYKMKILLKEIHVKNLEVYEIKDDILGKVFMLKFNIPALVDIQQVWKKYFLYCYSNFIKLSHEEQDRLSSTIRNWTI